MSPDGIPRRTDLWPRAWRRRPAATAAVILMCALLAWARLHGPAGTDSDRYHNRTFACVAVVDGDTIDIDAPDGRFTRTRIRLWGVDAPETEKRDTPAMYFGPQATACTQSLVKGKSVRVVMSPDRARDPYGRLLAYLYVPDGETMLNEELLRRGCAYADHRFDHPWRERFEQLEQRAERHKEGLWAHVKPNQMPPWRQRYLESTAASPASR